MGEKNEKKENDMVRVIHKDAENEDERGCGGDSSPQSIDDSFEGIASCMITIRKL